jgi:hypothetical protein
MYRDPELLSQANRRIYGEIAEKLRDMWDRLNVPADDVTADVLPQYSMDLRPEKLRVLPDLLLNKLGRQMVPVRVSEAQTPENAYLCTKNIKDDKCPNARKEIVIVNPKFRNMGIIEQAFALIEEAYHAHQNDMTDEYADDEIDVSDPRYYVYKLYTINFTHPAKTVASSEPYKSYNKETSVRLRQTQRPNFYLQEGDIIYGAYYNQPHDYNAKYVAGYIIGRALCYKNQKPDPMAVVGEFSRKDFRSGFHEHFHCK